MARVILSEGDFANLELLPRTPGLARLLRDAVAMRSEDIPPEVVTMQSQVRLVDEATGERRIVRLVYPHEADPGAQRISVLDSLGTALLGASPGARLAGRFIVEQVVFQPEDSMRSHLVVRDGGAPFSINKTAAKRE